MRLTMVAVGLLLTACGGAPANDPVVRVEVSATEQPFANAGSTQAALPADVVAFRLKRDECDHLRGEEPTDPARAAFLQDGMERTCAGTDAALRSLRQRHAGDPAAIAALVEYADDIE